ncbi:MAG TPA: flagellar protein FlaG [Burkholderiales bacterium]|nr:flagellar protein FlaG [Burkholderiales bacterium]
MVIGSIDGLAPAPVRDTVVAPAGAAQTAPSSVAAPAAPPAPEAVKKAVTDANDALRSLSQAVEFEYDADANVTVIRLVDTSDKKVLRQVPSPEMLEIARALERMQTMLVRGKA